MAQNTSKNRKSEEQKIFDQAENAGRFAGNDQDSQSARKQAAGTSGQSRASSQEKDKDENSDTQTERNANQTHDYKGEAQKVNDDAGRPSIEDETRKSKRGNQAGKK